MMEATLSENGRRIVFFAWTRETICAAALDLPMKIAPSFFLADDWLSVAHTLKWFDASGQRVKLSDDPMTRNLIALPVSGLQAQAMAKAR